MVVIRLSRGGTNKRPFYYVVVADSRCARDGRFIEELGYFNPIAKGGEKRLELSLEKVNAWIKKGATPSERVANLILEAQNPEKATQQREKNKAKRVKRVAKKKAATAKPEAAEATKEEQPAAAKAPEAKVEAKA